MIIGEFNESNFDNYEEDSYDYMLKPRSKPTRREKRLNRKDNKSQKGGLSKGKRKHPLIGNFGMFDKNKRKGAVASSDTIKVGVQSADMNVDTPPPANEPEMPPPSSVPAEAAPANTTPVSSSPALSEPAPDNAEVKLSSNAVNAIVASEDAKENSPAVGRVSTPGSAAPSKAMIKEDVKKSNTKEAAFSPLLGFAFLGVALIMAGFAFFKSQQKSQQELNPLKPTA
jgi:hypothetical protein